MAFTLVFIVNFEIIGYIRKEINYLRYFAFGFKKPKGYYM